MHIADGIIDPAICIAAHVVSAGWIYVTGKNMPLEEIPKLGMVGAALFVASLIHIPFAGASIHLGLFGIAGMILGKRAFPAIFVALLFQSLIFQHGGILTLGVNAFNMGTGALISWLIWRIKTIRKEVRALFAGFTGIFVPTLLMAAEFHLSGYGRGIFYLFSAYLLLASLEAIIALSFSRLLHLTKGEGNMHRLN